MDKEQVLKVIKSVLKCNFRAINFSSDNQRNDYSVGRDGLSYIGDFSCLIHDSEIKAPMGDYSKETLLPGLEQFYEPYTKTGYYVYTVDENIDIFLNIRNNESYLSIRYYGFIIKMYHYKIDEEFFINGIIPLDAEFFKDLNFKEFKKDNNYKYKYSSVYDYDLIHKLDNWEEVLKLYIEDDKFYYYESLMELSGRAEHEFILDISSVNFKTLVVKNDCYTNEFKLPKSCEKIIFDIEEFKKKKETWLRTEKEDIKNNCISRMLEYSNLFENEKDRLKGKEIQHNKNLQKKYETLISLTFDYNGVFGQIFTNKLYFDNMDSFYKDKKVPLKVLNTTIEVEYEEFKKHLNIKKIKSLKKRDKNQGNIDWWLEEFEEVDDKIFNY